MLTKELMTKKIISVTPEDTLLKAWELMSSHEIRHLVVMKEGQVAGMLSDRDLLKAINSLSEKKVQDYMSWPVLTVSQDTPIEKVVEEVMLEKVSAFLVDDQNKKTLGIITTEDLLVYLYMLIRLEKKDAALPLSGLISSYELY